MDEATQAPVRARVTPSRLAIAGVALAFACLVALVVVGGLARVDRYALVHWMPGFDPSRATRSIPPLTGLFMPFQLDDAWWQMLLDTVLYPASLLVSILVFAGVCVVLVRRGENAAALVWAVAWPVASALEVAAKVGIQKPALHLSKDGTVYHVVPFDHSFPSGHALRAVLVAGLVVYAWRRLAWPAAIWVLVVAVCLVATSWHVPSDVAGGLLLGLLVVLVAYAVLGSGRARWAR